MNLQRKRKQPYRFNPDTDEPQLQKSIIKTYQILGIIKLDTDKYEIFWAPELKLNKYIKMIKSHHSFTLDKYEHFFIINWNNTIESQDMLCTYNNIVSFNIYSDSKKNRIDILKNIENWKQNLINEYITNLESNLESDCDSKSKLDYKYKVSYNLTAKTNNKKKKLNKEKKQLTFHEIVLKEMESKTYNGSKEAGIDPEFYYSVIYGLCRICTKDWVRQYRHYPPCDEYVNNNYTPDMKICDNTCICGNCVLVCKNHCNCK